LQVEFGDEKFGNVVLKIPNLIFWVTEKKKKNQKPKSKTQKPKTKQKQ